MDDMESGGNVDKSRKFLEDILNDFDKSNNDRDHDLTDKEDHQSVSKDTNLTNK